MIISCKFVLREDIFKRTEPMFFDFVLIILRLFIIIDT